MRRVREWREVYAQMVKRREREVWDRETKRSEYLFCHQLN